MKGLRTQENNKFLKFFKLVQEEASKFDSVFFLDCGQGNVFSNNQIECEGLFGWLIPKEKVKEFEPFFLDNSEQQHAFDNFYTSVDFSIEGDTTNVIIKKLDS
jgi:hypothetical protein